MSYAFAGHASRLLRVGGFASVESHALARAARASIAQA
jgi:hypothetical protein